MADELENNGQQVQGTSGHESETVSVGGLKASLQKLKTDHIDTKYTKPSGGIPSTDMTSAVQSSLGKADAAAPQSTTYTKTEVDAKFDEFAGPTYDPATRAIIFPATAKVSYDADTRAVVFG